MITLASETRAHWRMGARNPARPSRLISLRVQHRLPRPPPLARRGGTVRLPGSKSISNRVLLLAALSRGHHHVHDLLDSDDTRVMLDALRQLGCDAAREARTCASTGLGGRAAVHPQPSCSWAMPAPPCAR
jgi:hypothetical protein